ncbi:DUF2935 domain-containing protein, partial [Bacillus mycoides]
MNRTYKDSALFEHKFWLRVLGDHAQFLLDALAPKETADIQRAIYFVEKFDGFLSRINTVNLIEFAKDVNPLAEEIRLFKLSIIKKQLEGKIVIHFTPTFI